MEPPCVGLTNFMRRRRKIRRRRKRRNLFVQNTFTSNYKLAIGLSECNNIRKRLNKIIRARYLARQQIAES